VGCDEEHSGDEKEKENDGECMTKAEEVATSNATMGAGQGGEDASSRMRCGRKHPRQQRGQGRPRVRSPEDHALEMAWLAREKVLGRNEHARWAKGRQAWLKHQQWQHSRRARQRKATRNCKKPRQSAAREEKPQQEQQVGQVGVDGNAAVTV
jgi:hypothetical protein